VVNKYLRLPLPGWLGNNKGRSKGDKFARLADKPFMLLDLNPPVLVVYRKQAGVSSLYIAAIQGLIPL
jgi:hypothetical protein